VGSWRGDLGGRLHALELLPNQQFVWKLGQETVLEGEYSCKDGKLRLAHGTASCEISIHATTGALHWVFKNEQTTIEYSSSPRK
jgi:hypothetical protein